MSNLYFAKAIQFRAIPRAQLVLFRNSEIYQKEWTVDGYTSATQTLNVTIVESDDLEDSPIWELQGFTWQWWAESVTFYGDYFYATSPRCHVVDADKTVPVPETMRYDLEQLSSTHFAFELYRRRDVTSLYTHDDTGTPSTITEYSFSNGQPYRSGDVTIPTPLFVTFGDIDVGECEVVHFIKYYKLPFNGGLGAVRIGVFVDGVEVPWNASSPYVPSSTMTYGTYIWNKATQEFERVISGFFTHIAFNSSEVIGVDSNSVVLIYSTDAHRSASSTTARVLPKGVHYTGGVVPAYGISQVANYLMGDYPCEGTIFQSRLVLGGVPTKPLSIAISAPFNSLSPEYPYSYFQITDANPINLAPFTLNIKGTSGEVLFKLMDWQSLILVFSDKAIYRIYSYGESGLSVETVAYSVVSAFGVVSNRSVIRTEYLIIFLSHMGLYALELSNQFEGIYSPQLMRPDCTKLFASLRYEACAAERSWLLYDNIMRLIYVGLPEPNFIDDKTTYRLYTVDAQTGGMSEYTTPGGFLAYDATMHAGFPIISLRVFKQLFIEYETNDILVDSESTTLVPVLLRMGYLDAPLDFVQASDSWGFVPRHLFFEKEVTTVGQRTNLTGRATESYLSMDVMPFGVNDLLVYEGNTLINYSPIPLQTPHYRKTSTQDIVIKGTGNEFVISPRASFDSDNYLLGKIDEESKTFDLITYTTNNLNNQVGSLFGIPMSSYWISPALSLGNLSTIKRAVAISVWLDTTDLSYSTEDVYIAIQFASDNTSWNSSKLFSPASEYNTGEWTNGYTPFNEQESYLYRTTVKGTGTIFRFAVYGLCAKWKMKAWQVELLPGDTQSTQRVGRSK